MSLETAPFFRFYNIAGSNSNELYEKFEFVIKDVNLITYGWKPIILSPLKNILAMLEYLIYYLHVRFLYFLFKTNFSKLDQKIVNSTL